jgi:hypothetical protein
MTGLPAYRPPVVESVCCYCRRHYRVFTGEDYQLKFAQKEAAEMGADHFVDARLEPFVTCPCGQSLDFAPECTLIVQ